MKKIIPIFLTLFFFAFAMYAQNYNVTFKVNMSVEIAKGKFDPAQNQVSVRGSFNGWGETPMADPDGDKIYEVTAQVPAGKLEYKFFHNGAKATNGGWESIDNRVVQNVASDLVLDVVYYDNIPMPSGNPANVTFKADMRLPIKQGELIPGTGKVFVAGDFNSWSTSQDELIDDNNDSVYTKTVQINSGQMINYKFLYTNKSGGTTWEGDPNKQAWIEDGDNVIERYFNDINPNVQLADGNITFNVDMSVLEELGIYDPAVDRLQVRGGFNGWSDSDAPRSVMNQDPLIPTNWFLQVPFVKTEVGSKQEYKFYVALGHTDELWQDGWERPLSMGGGNRVVNFAGDNNQVLAPVYYDDVYPQFVVPQGQQISVKFRVDMTDAMDPNKTGDPMQVGDKVYWISEQPVFARLMSWVDSDEQTYFELTDPDGDKIYEGTLTVTGPGINAFEYRYAFQRQRDGSFKQETAGFGKNAYRVRFCAMTGSRQFVQPYTAPLDKWTDKEDKSDQVELWPQGLPTDVREINLGIPKNFSLEQNYPNPFNPTTRIRFTIPSKDFVTMKVYNTLGEEVAVLINKEMNAGSYEVDFIAQNLSSGVYFYTLKTSNFIKTMKMLLIK
ncbi:MAG: carbohydrate-binding module family 20 domain-containing protein [Melioribacter sp.]|uniref:carbohydrate-binding module family 20 domain-containing protein n=1 Tax=Rosettibacter primus TaxID=3111523 RepID=UPI00247EB0AC|nr:carbohydrate-binding module family 20 domain-containing protein [Melioribacter sp.]